MKIGMTVHVRRESDVLHWSNLHFDRFYIAVVYSCVFINDANTNVPVVSIQTVKVAAVAGFVPPSTRVFHRTVRR